MYSNISEAWENDPVKEMTNKLSSGIVKTYPERSEVFNFKNHNNNSNSNNNRDALSLTESISILSDNNSSYNSNIPYASFTGLSDASVNRYDRYGSTYPKKHRYNKYHHDKSEDSEYSFF